MNRCGFATTDGLMETVESVNQKMNDRVLLQSIREICNTAVNACSVMYTDNTLGQKQIALRILEELDRENEKTKSTT